MIRNDFLNEDNRRAVSYLRDVARLEKRFQALSDYRLRLQSMAEGGTPRPLGTVSGGSFDGREEILARLADLDRDLAQEMDRLLAVRKRTWDLFSQLSHPKACQLLEDFYLNGIPIHVIATREGYSERHMYKMKDQALRELGKLLADDGDGPFRLP